VKLIFAVMFLLFLAGCGPSVDSRFDTGYSDGYAEGYNTACKIRATLVEGDWDDENYSMGYRAGNVAGAEACRSENN
jgi:hypothetical protein